MSKKPLQLAKLTRLRIHRAIARERLFKLLDETPAARCVDCGATGSGQDDAGCELSRRGRDTRHLVPDRRRRQ